MPKNLTHRLKNTKSSSRLDWPQEVKETNQIYALEMGNLSKAATTIDHGIMVEVLVDGQFAYCGTADISDQTLQIACDRAIHLARCTCLLGRFFPLQRTIDQLRNWTISFPY